VVECRAGGEQDVEARLRTLEQQRTDDHKHFLEIRDHCLKLGAELDRKTEKEAETARYLQELTARGLQFQQALVLQKVALEQAVKKAQEETFKIAADMIDVKIAEVVVGTADALNKLQAHVLQAFVVTNQGQAEDKKIIEQTFVDAAYAMDSLKNPRVPTSATSPVTFATGASFSGATVAPTGSMVFTKDMYNDIDAAINSIKKTANDQMFMTGRVDLLWKQVEAQTNVVQVHESSIQQLQSAAAAAAPTGPCKPCCSGVLGAIGVPTDEAAAPKPTDDGSVMSTTLLKVIGGNGQCHCVHVDMLIKQVEVIEQHLKTIKSGSNLRADAPSYGAYPGADPFTASDPWGSSRPGGAGGHDGGASGGAHGGGPGRDGMPRDATGKLILPLTLREHVGSLGYKDKPAFDEKLSERDEYKPSGKAGTGITWKGKVECHFISRAPVMMYILKWAGGRALRRSPRSA